MGHDIKHDWLKTVGGIGNVAEFCRPETIIYSILGDHWNSERVHFLVTADKFEGDEAVARKPPLQIMNRRKHLVSIFAAPHRSETLSCRFQENQRRRIVDLSIHRILCDASQPGDGNIQRVFFMRLARNARRRHRRAPHPDLPPGFPGIFGWDC